jgi:hypothetical protein
MQAEVYLQDSTATDIQCPKCGRSITLYHACQEPPKPNDGIGRLDLGEQNYSGIVCMYDRCDFAGDITKFKLPG